MNLYAKQLKASLRSVADQIGLRSKPTVTTLWRSVRYTDLFDGHGTRRTYREAVGAVASLFLPRAEDVEVLRQTPHVRVVKTSTMPSGDTFVFVEHTFATEN